MVAKRPAKRKARASRRARVVAPKRKPAVARPKKPVRRKKTARRKKVGPLRRIENAIILGAAELDEIALDMGLLGAAGPPAKKRGKPRR